MTHLLYPWEKQMTSLLRAGKGAVLYYDLERRWDAHLPFLGH